jgi:Ca2+-dependent lipid-binding protein
MDTFSKSDPLCVVSMKPFGSQNWVEVKRTECIQNNLNPQWVTKVPMTYMFEEQQYIKFDVYDLDSTSRHLDDHDFLGGCTTTLGQVVSNRSVILDLIHPDYTARTNGSLTVSCEELSMCKDEMEMQFLGKKLDKKDWFGSSDPFLTFSRSNEGGNYTLVHKTEHINNNINPLWNKFLVPIRTLCNGDYDRNIKIECYDHNSSGNHSLIGEFYVTVRQLLEGPGPDNIHDVMNPKKKVTFTKVLKRFFKCAYNTSTGSKCVRYSKREQFYSSNLIPFSCVKMARLFGCGRL